MMHDLIDEVCHIVDITIFQCKRSHTKHVRCLNGMQKNGKPESVYEFGTYLKYKLILTNLENIQSSSLYGDSPYK